jgi:hypothetical protein
MFLLGYNALQSVLTDFTLVLFFVSVPEDRGETFHRNVASLSMGHTVL